MGKRLVIIDGCKDCPYHQKPSSRDKETINSLHYCKKSGLYSVKFEKLYEYCPLPEHKEEEELFKLDQSYSTITGGKLLHMKYKVENSIGDDKKKPKLNMNV